jgi:hypothetical protein
VCPPESLFASRHGDTPLSLSLLQTIARKDPSAMTAIAAMQGLVLVWMLGESETRVEH